MVCLSSNDGVFLPPRAAARPHAPQVGKKLVKIPTSSKIKLIDFGLAFKLSPGEMAAEVCGTTSYMSPEVLKGGYAMECDVWSLGVITYFMLSGTLPFPGKNDQGGLMETG